MLAVSGVGIGSIPIGSSKLYSPLRDQSLSASEKLEQFAIWVSSYYPPIDNLSEVELEDLTSRKPLHLPESPHHDPQMRPTIEQMSLDEFASMTDVGALDRSSQFLIRVNQTIYRRNFERAHWFDSNIPLNERIWPNLKILVLWCNMDMVDCIWAISHFHRRWKNHLDDINQPGWEKCRNIEFLKFEGGNHFVSTAPHTTLYNH